MKNNLKAKTQRRRKIKRNSKQSKLANRISPCLNNLTCLYNAS